MDALLISGIQHFVFCRRQWALIHIEQAWKENFLTLHGEKVHSRVDDPYFHEKRKEQIQVRSLRVHSLELEIEGVCDLVELTVDSKGVYLPRWDGHYKIMPVEYKRGTEKSDNSDVYQLLAQAICLEEMTASNIEEGAIFYDQIKRRQNVVFTEAMRTDLKAMVREMHTLFRKAYTPKVKRTAKCRSCSLKEICLPELGNRQAASTYIRSHLEEESS
ncbi:CRISPR-associated protein Cas4 [Aedoeadaptatus ivorii]|uniref:CRISPR-associated exonuclease Cas4 n=1 Tax=Aedoeadaptatus ivorii TaxID=54006 RepID=A0A448V3G6_9FIRM|nr:CRISPR-associated protein Cas4 [Peptoniphilus ivorii]VEJ36339.1 CRISPR-associated protein Cas4 [Peptoniphilus ivorii]